MKNFNSFEDFGNQKINETVRQAPFYDSVGQMNAILENEEIAGKMQMIPINSMTYSENLTWILKDMNHETKKPSFILTVTLIEEGKGMYDSIKYTVSKIVKTIATP